LIQNENDCNFIRSYLLNKLTTTKHQIASRIVTAIDSNSKDTLNNSLVQAELGKNSKWITNMIVHYTHEQRLESYKKRYSSMMESTIYRSTSDRQQTHS
jgi:hypothetical protein